MNGARTVLELHRASATRWPFRPASATEMVKALMLLMDVTPCVSSMPRYDAFTSRAGDALKKSFTSILGVVKRHTA